MQNFNNHVAGLAIELFNNGEVYSIAKVKQTGLFNSYAPINEA